MDGSCEDEMNFVTRTGTYHFEVILFGLMNHPPTFWQMMDTVLKNVDFAQAYQDKIVANSKNMEEHITYLLNVSQW